MFMRNRESAFWKRERNIFDAKLRSSVRISHGSEIFGFRCCATQIIITSIPMFAMYRVKVSERIILFVKIVNQQSERKEYFTPSTVPRI